MNEPFTNHFPIRIGGLGKSNKNKQFQQGNRIYDIRGISVCLNGQTGGLGRGGLYVVKSKRQK